MTNSDSKSNSNKLTFSGQTGQHNECKISNVYVTFDDPSLGPLKNQVVEVVYADRAEYSDETDSAGKIKVSRAHGLYVDAKLSNEFGTYRRRVFIFLADPSTEAGAWQRLVNLGYVLDRRPPDEPPSDEALAMAIEDFQADHEMDPTGEADGNIFNSIKKSHDVESKAWQDRTWKPLSDSSEEEQGDCPKVRVS